jgi:hypothetical protein
VVVEPPAVMVTEMLFEDVLVALTESPRTLAVMM